MSESGNEVVVSRELENAVCNGDAVGVDLDMAPRIYCDDERFHGPGQTDALAPGAHTDGLLRLPEDTLWTCWWLSIIRRCLAVSTRERPTRSARLLASVTPFLIKSSSWDLTRRPADRGRRLFGAQGRDRSIAASSTPMWATRIPTIFNTKT